MIFILQDCQGDLPSYAQLADSGCDDLSRKQTAALAEANTPPFPVHTERELFKDGESSRQTTILNSRRQHYVANNNTLGADDNTPVADDSTSAADDNILEADYNTLVADYSALVADGNTLLVADGNTLLV